MWQGFPRGFGFLLSNRRPGLVASMLLRERVNIPQGLKPAILSVVCGPAKAVPLLQN
jgi:hypothetical protein